MTPEAMASLHAACFVTPRPWTAAEFRDLAASPGVFVEASASGFAVGRALAGEFELLTLAVSPEARRRGTGRALLERSEVTARTLGAARAFLEVDAENVAARMLYEAAGYRLAGRRRGYYRAPDGGRIDALVLEKHLA